MTLGSILLVEVTKPVKVCIWGVQNIKRSVLEAQDEEILEFCELLKESEGVNSDYYAYSTSFCPLKA